MDEELEKEVRRGLAMSDEWETVEDPAEFVSEARAFLALRLAGPFVSLEEGERRTQEMIARKRRERAVETTCKIDHAKICAVLAGEIQTSELTTAENSVRLDRFTDLVSEPVPDEEAFFVERRRRGLEQE